MKTQWKVLIVTLVVAVPAFMLGAGSPTGEAFWDAVWPFAPPGGGAEPSSSQMPFFMVLGAVEAISLGLAVSFLAFGWPLVRRVAGEARGRAIAMFAAVAWVLGNWWMHDNIHITNGENMGGLLVIEYVFHVTLMIAGAYLALALGRSLEEGRFDARAQAKEPGPASVRS